MKPHSSLILCAIALLVSATPRVFAQVASGTLTGVLTDGADAPVPGATVTATAVATNASRTVVTSAAGVYTVPALLPGEYRVDVELQGFQSIRRSGIRITTGETARLNLQITVGDV